MTTMVNPPASKSKSNPLVYTPFLQPPYEHRLVTFLHASVCLIARRVISLNLVLSLVLATYFPHHLPLGIAAQTHFT
jgi:hypothetical protein